MISLFFSLDEWSVRKQRANFLIDNQNKSGGVQFPIKRNSVLQPDLLSKETSAKIMTLKPLFSDAYINQEE